MSDEYLFNRKEMADANRFMTEHVHSNLFFFRFETGSGVGTNAFIKCEKCGKEENITDYESW